MKANGLEIRYLVDGSAKRSLGIFELTIHPGARNPPAHSHAENEECMYILEGTLRYRVDTETRDLGPGDWMVTPPGRVHHFDNTTTAPVRALVIMAPDIGIDYFREMFEIFGAGGPPDLARAERVMRQYGVVPAPGH